MSDRQISNNLDRSVNAIRNRRQKLDIKRPDSHSSKFNDGIHWDEEKDQYLRDNYSDTKYSDIAAELGCSESAVKCRAARLNLEKQRRLSDKEIEIIENMHTEDSDYTMSDIGDKLGLTRQQVANAISTYNLSYREQREFTEDEIQHIKENYSNETVKSIAERFDRNWGSVMQKIQQLGLKKTPKWTDNELEFIKDNWQDMSDSEIADQLKRPRLMVGTKRRDMGLKHDTFVDTKNHWRWEKLCEKVAKSLYDSVETQNVFDNDLRPDIFVQDKNLVIDAKLGVYKGAVSDVKKYYSLDQVDEVIIWSCRSYKPSAENVKILDKNNLKQDLNDAKLINKLEEFEPDNQSYFVEQYSLKESFA